MKQKLISSPNQELTLSRIAFTHSCLQTNLFKIYIFILIDYSRPFLNLKTEKQTKNTFTFSEMLDSYGLLF